MISSDKRQGLEVARQAVFPGVPWQRRQLHLQRNAQAYVPRLEMREEVATCTRSILAEISEEQDTGPGLCLAPERLHRMKLDGQS